MQNKITELVWDSNFFKLRVGRLLVLTEADLDSLKTADFDLVYVFSKNEIRTPENNGLKLVDKKVIFHKKISYGSLKNNEQIVSVVKSNKELIDLALLSGNFSRFKLDEKLNYKFNEMYTTWLERSLNRELASEVFSHEYLGDITGFVTIKKTGNVGVIGLIAVSEKHQGRQIGSQLMQAAEKWCFENEVEMIEVATQLDNVQACNFYRKNGYSIKQIEHIYHYYSNSI